MSSQSAPRIFVREEIEGIAKTAAFQDDLMKGVSEGFVAFQSGGFFAAPIQTLGAPPMAPFAESDNYSAQTCVKSGYFKGNPYYVIKVASGGHPWKENSGLMQVYSQSTGRLEFLLLDEGILTELRTAAVGSLAAKFLSPSQVNCVGMVGTGVQARYQLSMLKRVVSCRNLKVYGRSRESQDVFCKEMKDSGWNVDCIGEADQLLHSCELILTTSTSRTPVLGCSDIFKTRPEEYFAATKCRLIVCIGADAPGKAELSDNLIQMAHLHVADNPEQSFERGEFQRLHTDTDRTAVCAFGNLIQDKSLHRQGSNDDRLVIFDSSGVALQDCVVAQMTVDVLRKD
jgi:ornithine cyclodeaminase